MHGQMNNTNAGRPRSLWVLTDGKAGDEANCLGVAEAIGVEPEIRRVNPGKPWVWLMPHGPIDPKDHEDKPGSPIAKPWPDMVIASGRRAVAYLRRIKLRSGGETFTVFLKDPRVGTACADFIWAPEHDGLRGANVMATLTAPHRISAAKLDAARAAPDSRIPPFMKPKIAVILGGSSGRYELTRKDVDTLGTALKEHAAQGAFLMVTPSRRTPQRIVDDLRRHLDGLPRFFWDGAGDNPYLHFLAQADALIVTADSHNMLSEAAATGTGIYLLEPDGDPGKFAHFHNRLEEMGTLRRFTGNIFPFRSTPIDATPGIAEAILKAYTGRRKPRAGV